MMNIRYLFSFIGLILFARCTSVYTAKVVSEKTGLPLKNITVILQNHNYLPSIVVKTETDSSGNFKLVIPFALRKFAKNEGKVYLSGEGVNPIDYELNKLNNGTLIKLSPKI